MYTWKFNVETMWNYHEEEDNGDDEEFVVAAKTFDIAWVKVKKLALAKKKKFTDTDSETGERKTWFPVSTELVGMERLDWIDG